MSSEAGRDVVHTVDVMPWFTGHLSLYFDTALSADPGHLKALLEIVPPENVLFGSDYPFGPPNQMKDSVERLENLRLDRELGSPLGQNGAWDLFPRCRETKPAYERSRIPEPKLDVGVRTGEEQVLFTTSRRKRTVPAERHLGMVSYNLISDWIY